MKKFLILSVTLNAVIILFFAGKRYYYSYGPGAGHDTASGTSFYDQWNSMRSSVYATLPIDSCDIVFVGNSLTEAFPVTEIFGKYVKNRGISGNSTIHLLNRIKPIAQKHPKKIFIEIGVNDFNFGYSVESAFHNYEKIIHSIKTYSPRTQIFVQSLMPTCMSYKSIIHSIDSLNVELRQYCRSQQITYIDLYTPMLKSSGLDSAYTADGIHLNNKGYAVWRRQIEKFVN
jgi:lysophospholipase L1-like esterase